MAFWYARMNSFANCSAILFFPPPDFVISIMTLRLPGRGSETEPRTARTGSEVKRPCQSPCALCGTFRFGGVFGFGGMRVDWDMVPSYTDIQISAPIGESTKVSPGS